MGRASGHEYSYDGGSYDGGSYGGGSYSGGSRLDVVGLTEDQRLVRFNTDDPSSNRSSVRVVGLAGDVRLVGIDYRVQNRRLYGVGNVGGIYTLSPSDGRATKVSQLSVALQGTFFGVDFNPAANRLRVISDTGQNLRHNLDDVTAGAAPPAGTTAVDGTLTTPPTAGPTTGVSAAGYTNNDLDPNTATTLYDVATASDTLVLQSPANAGTLAATGKLTVDAGSSAGFDIYSTIRDSTTVDLMAYATLKVDGNYGLYRITLFSGRARFVGGYATGTKVMDIAIPLNQL